MPDPDRPRKPPRKAVSRKVTKVPRPKGKSTHQRINEHNADIKAITKSMRKK